MNNYSRRDALKLPLAAGGSLGLILADAAAAAAVTGDAVARLGLDDPSARSRLLAKLRGSVAEQTVYTFCRLHLFLWLNEGNLKPMLSMQNLNATHWRPLSTGNFEGTMYEVGVYTEFDTDNVIESWANPVTGDKREVWDFRSGPQKLEMGANGLITHAAAMLKPKEMRIDVLGETLLSANYSALAFPNPLAADKWPKEAGAPTFYWDSHYLFAASVKDLLNPRLNSAPATVQFQNLVSFHPWLGMGQHAGRTYGRGLGAKLRSLDELPRGARAALQKRTPEIFDLPNWKPVGNDFAEFTRQRKPT